MNLLNKVMPKHNRLKSHERGAVMVEFLIIFIVFFTFLLAIFQIFQVYLAKMYVQRAAIAAARSAAVVLPDHSDHYGNEPPYAITTGSIFTGSYLDWAGFDSNQRYSDNNPTRLTMIRTAAVYPLIPLHMTNPAGGTPQVQTTDLNNHTAVVFPNTPLSTSLRRNFLPNEVVNVRVTHGYECTIPLASKLVCLNRQHRFNGDFGFTGTSVPAGDHIVLSAESSFPLMDIGVLGDL